MRIAVCFSSQIRTGVITAPNIKNYIGDLYSFCDFFVHTWDIETLSQNDINSHNQDKTTFENNKNKPVIVKKEVFNKFYSLYNPISMVVEPYFSTNHLEVAGGRRYNKKIDGSVLSLFESIYECNLLKKNHEEKYGFKYDYVLRLRPDLVIHPRKKLETDISEVTQHNTLVYAGHKKRDYVNQHRIEDIFWISKSEILDQVSNFFEYESKSLFDKNNNQYDWQEVMNGWVINNLKISPIVLKDSTMCPYYISDLKINADVMGTEIYERQY